MHQILQTDITKGLPGFYWAGLLFGDGLQLVLLLVLLRQLSEAGQGRVHFLDGQEALGGWRERFAILEEHPHRLRHVALEKKKGGVMYVQRHNAM